MSGTDTLMTTLKVVDLTPHIGSEIEIEVEALLNGAVAAEIRALLEKRGVLVARNRKLDDEQLLAIAATLGSVRLGTVAKEGVDGILKVTFDRSQNPTGPNSFRGTFYWHMDGTFDDTPPLAAVLTPRILSAEGGDTEYANTYAAFDDLPEADKARFSELKVLHTMESAHRIYTPSPSPEQLQHWAKFPARIHPLVWRHHTGRKSLLLSSSVTRVAGMEEKESDALLARLMEWTTQPSYVYRHNWQMGDLLIWDNTGTMHRALPYDIECGRRLHRVTLEGEESFVTA